MVYSVCGRHIVVSAGTCLEKQKNHTSGYFNAKLFVNQTAFLCFRVINLVNL